MCAPRGLCIQKEIKTKNICMNVADCRKMRIGVPWMDKHSTNPMKHNQNNGGKLCATCLIILFQVHNIYIHIHTMFGFLTSSKLKSFPCFCYNIWRRTSILWNIEAWKAQIRHLQQTFTCGDHMHILGTINTKYWSKNVSYFMFRITIIYMTSFWFLGHLKSWLLYCFCLVKKQVFKVVRA